jgi:hypothetical protein
MQPRDLWLLLVAVAAALVARAAVLFGVLPLLSALRLSQKVSSAYKLAITWGGLRGAVTLALALSVTENPDLDSDSKDFVADLATGFALFTLLFNGLTLRPVIRLLKLDRLSPLNQAIRDKVLALSLADVREVIRHAAQTYRIAPATARAASQHYEQRIKELESQPSLENAISDQDWIRIGLIALPSSAFCATQTSFSMRQEPRAAAVMTKRRASCSHSRGDFALPIFCIAPPTSTPLCGASCRSASRLCWCSGSPWKSWPCSRRSACAPYLGRRPPKCLAT